MKRRMTILLLIIACLFVFVTGCGGDGSTGGKKTVVIYSSAEEWRNEHIQNRLNEQFPDYSITVQYQSTGNNGAKLKSEGTKTEADIVLALELSYMLQLEDILEDLSSYDTSNYLDDVKPLNNTYLTWERFSGCIAVNKKMMQEKNLPMPASYDDLLKPIYKGLISMPNPKASSTGYIFLKSLINDRGEDAAFDYFDKLAENVLHFTSSGSGPVNDLIQGEAAIGLGMVFQTVQQINEGNDLEILFFEPGSPYSLSGSAVIKGRLEKPEVKAVFDFIMDTLVHEDKQFSPELIFKDQTITIANYPKDVKTADMTDVFNMADKERVLERWEHQ